MLMKNDAFNADVEPGGLLSTDDIKILICYILAQIDSPMSIENIASAARRDKLANYFDVTGAVSRLIDDGNIVKDADGLCSLTDKGRLIASELKSRIPFTVREKAIDSAKLEILYSRRLKENDVSVISENHGYTVKISMKENGAEIMGISVSVGTLRQANLVKENFLSDPAAVYMSNMQLLLQDSGKDE